MKTAMRNQFLRILVSLLANGFSLQESFEVIQRTGQFPSETLVQLLENFQAGKPLADCFASLGFLPQYLTQIRLVSQHGQLQQTLEAIVQHQKLLERQRQALYKAVAYPALLLLFVASFLFGMRLFVLPSLMQSGMIAPTHWGVLFLRFMPVLIVVGGISILGSYLAVKRYFRKKTAIEKATFIVRIPLIGSLFTLYQTSYFAMEWGRLFKQGLEAQQIVYQLIGVTDNQLLTMVAHEIHMGMSQGIPLTELLTKYSFLVKEFPAIIYHGQVKGRLGEELLVYSQLLLTKLVGRVERAIQWVQPLIFLVVAVLILLIYMALLLPMYENIGGML